MIKDWDNIDPGKNSTILIIRECLKRGHKVSISLRRKSYGA